MITPDKCNRDRDCFVDCLLGCIFTWSGSSSYLNNLVLFNEWVMMAITHNDDFMARAEGE
jgi:hypothetical protein